MSKPHMAVKDKEAVGLRNETSVAGGGVKGEDGGIFAYSSKIFEYVHYSYNCL